MGRWKPKSSLPECPGNPTGSRPPARITDHSAIERSKADGQTYCITVCRVAQALHSFGWLPIGDHLTALQIETKTPRRPPLRRGDAHRRYLVSSLRRQTDEQQYFTSKLRRAQMHEVYFTLGASYVRTLPQVVSDGPIPMKSRKITCAQTCGRVFCPKTEMHLMHGRGPGLG